MSFRSPEQRRAVMARLRGENGAHPIRPIETTRDIREWHRMVRSATRFLGQEAALRRAFRMSVHMVALSETDDWMSRLGPQGRRVAEREHAETARLINRRLQDIGSKARFDEKIGPGRVVLGEAAAEGEAG